MVDKRKGGGKRKSGGRKGPEGKTGSTGRGGQRKSNVDVPAGSGQRLSGSSRYLTDVMEIFQKLPGRPMNARQVASTMGIADRDIRDMLHILMREQAGKGTLVEVGRGRFMMPESATDSGRQDRRGKGRGDRKSGPKKELVSGTIQITQYGKGFVSIPGQEEDIMIPKGQTGTAFWGDTV
jgi:hypothetical protein